MPEIAIALVTYHNPRLLEQTLATLKEACGPLEAELLLVDNGSSPETQAIFERSGLPGRSIDPGENLGFARGNNRAFAETDAPFLLLLNDDVELPPEAIPQLLTRLENDPRIGVLGPRLLNPDGTLQPSCYGYPSFFKEFCKATGLKTLFPKSRWLRRILGRILGERFSRNFAGYWEHDQEREAESLKGACLLVRREVIDRVGPFDERWFMYGEELEWCFRIRQAGFKVLFFPGVEVVHHGGWERRGASHAASMLAEEYRGVLRFFRKHFPRQAPWYEGMLLAILPLRALISVPFSPDRAKSAWRAAGYAFDSLRGKQP